MKIWIIGLGQGYYYYEIDYVPQVSETLRQLFPYKKVLVPCSRHGSDPAKTTLERQRPAQDQWYSNQMVCIKIQNWQIVT